MALVVPAPRRVSIPSDVAGLPAVYGVPVESENSIIGRVVAALTPLFGIAAGWLAGLIAHAIPGLELDQTQTVAFMVTATTAVVAAAWKWLQGWQQHEQLVGEGRAAARKSGALPSSGIGPAALAEMVGRAVEAARAPQVESTDPLFDMVVEAVRAADAAQDRQAQ